MKTVYTINTMKIKLTKSKFYKFGISLAKGEVRTLRQHYGKYQVETDSGVWLTLNRKDFEII